jgi:Holliday junction resolvase
MSKINSKQKGKSGELEFSKFLQENGYQARRTQQYCGTEGASDVICNELRHVHFEVKRIKKCAVYKYYDQAERDRGEHQFPIVAIRANNREWIVTLNAEDFLELIRTAK